MAIRSGSGGLKYPLPNQQVQQAAASASAGGSASSAAYGANRRYAGQKMQIQASLANSAAERQFRAMSQLEGQQFQAQSQLAAQDFRAGESQLDRDAYAERQQAMFANQANLLQSGQRFTADQNVLQQTYQSDRDLRQIQSQQVAKLPDIPENARPQTKQHLQRLQTALQELVGQNWNPNDPATRDTFDQTYRDYQSIVQSIPKPDPTEKFQEETFVINGTRYQEGPNGQFVEVPNSAQANAAKSQQAVAAEQQKAEQKQRDEEDKLAKEYTQEINPETITKDDPIGKEYTPNQAMLKAIKELGNQRSGFDEARKQQQQSAAPGQNAPTGATSTTPYSGPPPEAAVPGAISEPEVQTVVSDIRTETKNLPIEEGKETPEMRSFLEKNLEDIVRYQNVPLDQVPDKARQGVDFYQRYVRSTIQGQPIVLRTPEEAAMLPPDTPFVDGDGKPRRTKKKQGAR